MHKGEKRLPGDLGFGLILGCLTSVIIFVGLSWLLWQIPFPFKMGNYLDHLLGWLSMEINSLIPLIFKDRGHGYLFYLAQLRDPVQPWMLVSRFYVALAAAGLFGILVGYIGSRGQLTERHIAGRQLHEGQAALRFMARRAKILAEASEPGLRLHPSFNWQLSIDRETRHTLVWGSPGGGKTQILIPWIRAARARGDKLIIFDNKGDFTSWLPDPFILVAPWDSRSVVWDVAKDCRNQQDARELAARLIADGHDPLWHMSARQILTAVIIRLQREQPGVWTWASLYSKACGSQDELMQTVKLYMPEARHLFESPGKTTQSVLINLGSNLSMVGTLAAAWGAAEPKKMFSFSNWLMTESPKRRTIVLQGSGRYIELARAYLQSVLTLVSSRINSPQFPDSNKRRLWFFLDEFPQLGLIKDFSPLLEIGRSKGVRVVIGAQDTEQIKNLYGEHTADSWTSMVGTQIVVRVNPGSTANILAKEIIGTRTVDRVIVHKGKVEPPQREYPLVIEPAQLGEDLGPTKNGVRALVLGFNDVAMLDWPFSEIPKLRPSSVPASWLLNSNNSERPSSENQDPRGKIDEPQVKNLKPHLKLRLASSSELSKMAATGTTLNIAAEDLSDFSDTAKGGTHEPR
ncbi:type IV secretion system coupling TraD/TrwB family protein [Jezberella montanilacus]|uniref:Type IV secretion system coupling TraD/TrwB family protein n=1 Tax=Jezberella montanilacus TaxID=323426 RepID=A0A2T0XQ74_9BURK|nr:type IV secretion system DNA-binding domain-containing protein [Jezberella montanilacus]PRZ01081.1 type IV secretion system coupling TraD/TrwB family protein [Jezberella montanilacus]